MDDLYELSSELKKCKTSNMYLNKLVDSWHNATNPAMKQNAQFYLLGALDFMYYRNEITQTEYTNWYKYLGL